VPRIHFGVGTSNLLGLMGEAGADVVGVDWRTPLEHAIPLVGDRVVQGNLDPLVLLAAPEEIRRRAKQVLDQAGGRPGHIFNLGHGVVQQTPVENAIALVDAVHDLSRR
jgi:uroporphyrinogen decarboxylase